MRAMKPDVAALVARMPESDEPGKESKFTGPDPAEAAKVFDEILAGGPESVEELISLVHDVTDDGFKDYRPEYVLHCLAVRVGASGMEAQKKVLAEAMASRLADEKLTSGVRGILLRKLQLAAGPEVAAAIGKYLLDERLGDHAALALVAIRDGAADELLKALPAAKGRNRLAIVQALGAVRAAGAVAALKDAVHDGDVDVRIAAVWALASIGEADGADAIIKASETSSGWERIQAAKACLVLAENLAAAGKKSEASRVYKRLAEGRTDSSEAYIREAAERGLSTRV